MTATAQALIPAVDVDALLDQSAVAVLTDPAQFEAFYDAIKAETDQIPRDVSTEPGRKAIASAAYKVARCKTKLDDAGKALTEDARAEIARVNAMRKTATERLDALKAEVRAALTDWEDTERRRAEGVERTIATLKDYSVVSATATVEIIDREIAEIEALTLDSAVMQDRYTLAVGLKEQALAAQRAAREECVKREAERAELAELRRLKEERDAADQAAREAEEAAERQAAAEAETAAREARLAAREAEDAAAQAESEQARATAQAERFNEVVADLEAVDPAINPGLAVKIAHALTDNKIRHITANF